MMFRQKLVATLSAAAALLPFNQNKRHDLNEKKRPALPYALSTDEKQQLNIAKINDKQPTIVSLYDVNDGAINADLAIQHLNDKGIKVVPVSPQEGLNHPIFKDLNNINGVYLPGGSDIPVNNSEDPRNKFEGQLIAMANKEDKPLLGICRGEQAIGHHNNLAITDLPTHESRQPHYDNHDVVVYDESGNPNFNNTVVVAPGSQLHSALQHKLVTDADKNIEYPVACLHHQHINENESNINQQEIKISGRNKFDHTIESLEIPTGKYTTFGFQHHPEVIINACQSDRNDRIQQIKAAAANEIENMVSIDSDQSIAIGYREARKITDVLNKKSVGEKAARLEFGLFINQVKKEFLEKQAAPGKLHKKTK
jgi:gamma-glutamyl-gamma-aminobutyrate hydrolase PuuD